MHWSRESRRRQPRRTMVVGIELERVWPACAIMTQNWTQLRELESESIYVLRETVAQFRNPVLLYSVGKDSSVLVHLARKAFYPGPLPFPFLHVDTGYKFKEMLEFRDRFTKQIGARLIVHRNEAAIVAGAHPLRSEEHTSELQSQSNLVCRLLLEKKKNNKNQPQIPKARKAATRHLSMDRAIESTSTSAVT